MLFLFWIFAEKRGWRGWWKSTAKTTHKKSLFFIFASSKSQQHHIHLHQLHLIAIMTVADTLTNEFNFIQLDDNNRTTPAKVLEEVNPISPESSSDLSISSSNSVCSDIAPSSFQRAEVRKSEHKLAELRGDHVEEPLLKENPNRFVLFPIEDNEVSIFNGSCDFFSFWWHVMQHPSHPTPSLHTHPT